MLTLPLTSPNYRNSRRPAAAGLSSLSLAIFEAIFRINSNCDDFRLVSSRVHRHKLLAVDHLPVQFQHSLTLALTLTYFIAAQFTSLLIPRSVAWASGNCDGVQIILSVCSQCVYTVRRASVNRCYDRSHPSIHPWWIRPILPPKLSTFSTLQPPASIPLHLSLCLPASESLPLAVHNCGNCFGRRQCLVSGRPH